MDVLGAAYLVLTLALLAILPRARAIEALPKTLCNGHLPRVSIVMPVKDEGDTVGDALASVLGQDYPDYEVILVYAESRDETWRVIGRFMGDRRLTVLKEPPLPSGWVGKNWACHIGYKHSSGDLILFTDGDTIHGRDLLRRAVCTMLEEGADMLTLIPRLSPRSFWEKLVTPLIGTFILIHTRSWTVNRDGGGFIGNGQYLLVRRRPYEEVGGHSAVRDVVIEDYAIAHLLHRAGFRLRVYVAGDAFRVKMYRDLRELWQGWSKNIFLGIKSFAQYLLYVLAITYLLILPPAVLLYSLSQGHTLTAIAVGAYSSLIVSAAGFVYSKSGVSPVYAVLVPVAAAIVVGLMTNSVVWYYRGRIVWKGRRYRSRRVFE